MRVGVTPTAGEAIVIITHAAKTNRNRSPTTFLIQPSYATSAQASPDSEPARVRHAYVLSANDTWD